MRKVLLALLAILPSFQSPMVANNAMGVPEEVPIPIKPDPNPNPTPNPGPRMRSRGRFVETSIPVCNYFGGVISIEAGTNITSISATITRLEDNMLFINSDNGCVLTVQVSEEPGTYVLHFTLSDGTGFCGEYTLE